MFKLGTKNFRSKFTKSFIARTLADAASHEILLAQWQGIVPKIGCLFNTLKANYVPPFLICQVLFLLSSMSNYSTGFMPSTETRMLLLQ
ncbi:hypothetical protein L1987_00534 [Smallanthus sonchifolius]|uniref:Uncharacterized protein n=1 Tax=Smallanthus sonchifolius TaxID=185202 RepID=A0ACB9K2D9_9ASTR|nr:hypothetical protein L1987_00534 [Smallanthus sonchifolius]